MTSLRECQALVAITSMHKSFQQLIFNPCETGFVVFSLPIYLYLYLSPSLSFCLILSLYTVIVQGTATGTLLSALSCPASVSSALWARLTEQFNESQLRAIRSLSLSLSLHPSSLSLFLSDQLVPHPILHPRLQMAQSVRLNSL